MKKEFKRVRKEQILSLTMAFAVAGLFTIPPAMAGSLSGGLSGSRAGNLATTRATTTAGAYGWGRQTYVNRHFIPHGYSLSSGSYRAAPESAPKLETSSSHGGATTKRQYKPHRYTATRAEVTTYKWGAEKDQLVDTKTTYK